MKSCLSLEFMAMVWLRVQKRCIIVTRERTLRYWAGQPDVLGVTTNRFMVECEAKRSVSDFHADFKKQHRANRDRFIDLQPREFYYLMPRDLALKLQPEIPEWAGLMTVNEKGYEIEILKRAPVNKLSKRLTLKECVKAVIAQTNFILALAKGRELSAAQTIHNLNMELRPNPELHFDI